MVEEASGNKSPEKSPQDDGTKVPLTDDGETPTIEEAKYVANPNGDAKIDVEIPPTFSGLTKEELMKYSNDPFWIRLRWFLFILFWLGWLAMLVVAIVIIVQAPGCKPPPELLWVEESPMLEVNPANLPAKEDLLSEMEALGVSSVYFPGLISNVDFQEMKYEPAIAAAAKVLIDAIVKDDKSAVTDLPASVNPNNAFFANGTSGDVVNGDGSWNFNNEALATAVHNEITDWWIDQGVKGFLIQSLVESDEEKRFVEDLNGLMKEDGGAVSSNIVETGENEFTPTMFQDFLDEHSGNWSFYRFNPSAVGSALSEASLRLVTVGLFLSPGTPVLNNYAALTNSTSALLDYLSSMKDLSGVQFGQTHFVNSSSVDVVAFTRVYKGTPAYAVALNFNANNETVSFEGTDNIGRDGTVEIHSKKESNVYETREKYDLTKVPLGPYEGMVLQFVAAF